MLVKTCFACDPIRAKCGGKASLGLVCLSAGDLVPVTVARGGIGRYLRRRIGADNVGIVA
jgi:hypothetical protein